MLSTAFKKTAISCRTCIKYDIIEDHALGYNGAVLAVATMLETDQIPKLPTGRLTTSDYSQVARSIDSILSLPYWVQRLYHLCYKSLVTCR